ncbi:hypothetical protein AAFX19_01895 [Vibrio harveyi]|uniref:hypothetical protein n=1 Tax=Vibrio harveyi TaxID=669 RepID=UPI002ADF37C3|nr:hypothetical protein [Vibrio harveyi]
MITLSKTEVIFMLTMLRLTPEISQVLEAIADRGGDIDDDIADELRDMCTDCLDEIGFDENYDLINDGERLEKLIDKLFIG